MLFACAAAHGLVMAALAVSVKLEDAPRDASDEPALPSASSTAAVAAGRRQKKKLSKGSFSSQHEPVAIAAWLSASPCTFGSAQ